MNTGWICIYRRLWDHWIWKDAEKLKWWIDLLLLVNHDDHMVNIGMQLIPCKRGQTVMSLKNLSERWNVSRDTARNFLTLLKKDRMILTENLTKTTRITICNYDVYQDGLHAGQTQSERQPNAGQTQSDINNNDNNYNKENNIIWKKDFKVYLSDLRDAYCKIISDKEWIQKQEKFNPGVDIALSVEKVCVNYWSTEAGWKKKKGTRITTIDWPSTFANAISITSNKVWKKTTQNEESHIHTA